MWLLALVLSFHDKSGEAIVARNIFCSDCRPARKPKTVRLVATLVGQRSFAILCRQGHGCAIVVAGEAMVARIEERRVVFDDGDVVGFEQGLENGDPARPPAPVQLDRATVTRALAHPEELVRTVTAVPAADGIRIVALRPGSPLALLGVQRGDLIRAVNGCELAGLDASLACYQRLRNVRYVSVALVRAGSRLTLDVALDRE